jgi:radial spoke head protein 9
VKDYFVVVSLDFGASQGGEGGFPGKRYFWCSSTNYLFSMLPQPQPHLAKDFQNMKTYLSGEYDRVLMEGTGAPIVIADDLVLPPKPVTELDRVAFTVHAIERQCQLVPRGSYKFTPLQQVQPNEAFRGLSQDEANQLASYHHFRPIEQKEKLAI